MATTDILSSTEARTACNISGSSLDTELALFISGITARIDALCGPVVARTITDEKHNGGSRFIVPRYTPLYSVTTLTEYVGTTGAALTAESLSSQPASAYLLDTSCPHHPYIRRRETGGDATFPSGRLNVVLTYKAGRYADTASVSEKFKLATTAILRRAWKREQSLWAQRPAFADEGESGRAEGFYRAIDPMVQEFLRDELLPPVAV